MRPGRYAIEVTAVLRNELDVGIIIYRDKIWSAWRSPEGWRDYVSPFGDPKDPTQRHLDHIHVEVT